MAHGPGGRGRGGPESFEDDEAQAHEQAMEELRERIGRKLDALRDRMVRDERWTEDEEHGVAVPPGWIRDPNYVAKPRG